MTDAELDILDLLVNAQTAFAKLPDARQPERDEFYRLMHAAKSIVLSLEGLRALAATLPPPKADEEVYRYR